MVGHLLGHTQMQTTMRYAHLADDSVRRALEENAGRLSDFMGSCSVREPDLRVLK
ncbi:hypothetical protein SAMN05444414_14220 [Roseovarius marisflavi]|uniref:Phage integrase family protein n=1 Tax=Roseovarius marisflavi TaxID=1054996 RepID=A0A1M7DJS5_9RHOB|nr:hypothetical protein [Roseovarius marisflavi]SHL79722.1 hypothetical protein SAMN05444414_14220 [Roseovarius marisflavi]